ncbi:MAG: DUF89 family protein [Deltaproteobacteria bacterium]|nr:DUF89 family protein [Candidatus Anaeroferrophillacea bacterium]
MRTYLDCYPCFLRQTLVTGRLATADEALLHRIMGKVMATLPDLPLSASPPELAQTVYGIITAETGVEDPYRELKQRANTDALHLLPELERLLAVADDPLDLALRIAAAGNLMDFGVQHDGFTPPERITDRIPETFYRDHRTRFAPRLSHARTLVYVGDNAGEIVADLALIRVLKRLNPALDVTFVVRDGPIINDVTMDDAHQVGMDSAARVLAGGARAPALLPDLMAPAVQQAIANADLVIAKGQGNYESLSQVPWPLYFLLHAKCPIVARHLEVPVGAGIFAYHPGEVDYD